MKEINLVFENASNVGSVFTMHMRVGNSQLCGVLGNALRQQVQPSVATAHHAIRACAGIGTARGGEAAVILCTWGDTRGSAGY